MNPSSPMLHVPNPGHSRSASTLAATMLVVAAVVALLTISVLITSQFGRYAGRQGGDSDEMAACDAALDYAYGQWKTTTYNSIHGTTGNVPASNACYPSNGTSTTPGTPTSPNNMAVAFNTYYNSTFASGANVTCFNLQIMATDQNGVPASYDTNGEPVFTVGTPTKLQTSTVPGYPGWYGWTYNYVAVAGVTANGHFGNPKPVSATRYFQVTKVPLFQAAIFYENKLELHPGAAMIVTGPVHSNGDIWARGYSNLQFNSPVSYVGKFYNYADPSVYYGWDGSNYGTLPGYNYSSPLPTWGNGTNTSSGSQLNQVSSIDPFGGASTNNNGLHDIVEVPATGSTSDQIAYNNASLRIIINDTVSPTITSGSTTTPNPAYITMYDKTGTALSSSDYNAIYAALNSYPTANVTSGSTGLVQSIQDLRESATVKVTSLDMTKLAAVTTSTGSSALKTAWANSGTVYIHYLPRTSSNPLPSSQRDAIRLYNGGTVGENVTVATDNGLYVQGDYNTGTNNATANSYQNVPSNQTGASTYAGGTGSPVISGYNRYATSVMADAVTILSNNWKDSLSSDTTLTDRQAVPTTVNTAILAGDVASNYYAGVASGGAHNFPRFLENWSNVNFTYYGSLVEAYRSASYTGQWRTSNVYSWPNRMWNFDVNLLNNLPPGVPMGLQFTRGRWQRVTVNSDT